MPPHRTVQIEKSALKYFNRLDKPTQQRIRGKIAAIATDPFDVRHSKPLTNCDRRSARVGALRILFAVTETVILVTEIDGRGDIYKNV